MCDTNYDMLANNGSQNEIRNLFVFGMKNIVEPTRLNSFIDVMCTGLDESYVNV